MSAHFRGLFLAAALAAAAPAGAAELSFDPALSRSPPELASASFEPLARPDALGNALLRLRFADERRGTSLVIQGGPGPTLLRDDGVAPDTEARDGLYTALVQINGAQFVKEQQRRIGLARTIKTVPEFRLRQRLSDQLFQPSALPRLQPGVRVPIDRFLGLPNLVDPERELLVRQLSVVDDPLRTYEPCTGAGTPLGAWTFGRLMTEMANEPVTGMHPADFTEAWLQQWTSDQLINGFNVPRRAIGMQNFLAGWPRGPDGRLDLAQAPFRLLAIVNRLDLRGNLLYGPGDSAEARLVFGGVRCVPLPNWPPVETLQFTVIFEYGVPAGDCVAARSWAQQWHALGALPLGSPAYNTALQAITDQFTLRNARPTRQPNLSAIHQVRTNEFALADGPADTFWELRESRLTRQGQLTHQTLAQTPDRWRMDSIELRDYVNANQFEILGGRHAVPNHYPVGTPFKGGSLVQSAGIAWDAVGIVSLEARHRFSVATCNACHKRETSTPFVHIAPRNRGAVAALSDFLTGAGMPVADPVSGVPRHFHDLLDRQMKLDATANLSCQNKHDLALQDLFVMPQPAAFPH
jgi:hypothetical protein